MTFDDKTEVTEAQDDILKLFEKLSGRVMHARLAYLDGQKETCHANLVVLEAQLQRLFAALE